MKKIRILGYVTPGFKWKYRVNWLISAWTLSKYSHVEIWVANDIGFFDKSDWDYMWQPLGTCYTATMRGEDNGTVKRDASLVLDHPENWEYIELEISDELYDKLIIWMDFQVANNLGYSKWDLLNFLSPIHLPDNRRNICSEFVGNALYVIRIFLVWGIITPKEVIKRLIAKGYKPKKLRSK